MELRGGTAINDRAPYPYADLYPIPPGYHRHYLTTDDDDAAGVLEHRDHDDDPDLRRVRLQRGGSTGNHYHYVGDFNDESDYDLVKYGPAVYPDGHSDRGGVTRCGCGVPTCPGVSTVGFPKFGHLFGKAIPKMWVTAAEADRRR